jgi:transposase
MLDHLVRLLLRALNAQVTGTKPLQVQLFCGSDRGGQRAAIIYTLIQTAKLNDVDPQAWLADALSRIAECPISKLDQLLPWNWAPQNTAIAA